MRIVWLGLLLWSVSGCAQKGVSDQSGLRLYETMIDGVHAVESDSLVVVSYNIQFAEKMDQALVDLTEELEVRLPDILLLQEMDAEGVAFLADRLKMNSVYFPSYYHSHHGRLFGTAVLSPWPLVAPRYLVLPHGIPFSEKRRTALAVDVQVGQRVVQAVSVHLSTVVVELADRVEQATAVRDSLVANSGPTIVGGDFNSGTEWENVLFRRVVRKAGFKEARPPEDRTARSSPLGWFGHRLKLDHIYFRDLELVASGVSLNAVASDHFPVWSVYRWPD